MARIKYKTKGIDRKGRGPLPKPGVYTFKVTGCQVTKPSGKDRRIELIADINSGEFKGARLYDYINLESEAVAWKLGQFVDSLGLPEDGELDPDKLVGETFKARTRIRGATDEFEAKADIAQYLSSDGDEETEDDEEPDAEDAEGAEDEDGAATADDELWTREELDELSLDELKEQCEEFELDHAALLKGKKAASAKKAALAEAILEAQGGGDDDDAPGDEDDELWTEEELNELDDDDLKEQLGEFELDEADYVKTTGRGKQKKTTFDRDGAIAGILEAQGGGEDDEDGEEEDDGPDYEAMNLSELKKLANERGLSPKGTAAVLRKRLQKDDEPV